MASLPAVSRLIFLSLAVFVGGLISADLDGAWGSSVPSAEVSSVPQTPSSGRSSIPPAATSTTTASPDEALFDLASEAMIPATCDLGPSQYVGGHHPESESGQYAQIANQLAVDTDRDGTNELLVEVLCTSGAVWSRHQFVFDENGALQGQIPGVAFLGEMYTEERRATVVREATIEGALILTGYVWATNDARCCPSVEFDLIAWWNATEGYFEVALPTDNVPTATVPGMDVGLTPAERQALRSVGYTTQTDAPTEECMGADTDGRRKGVDNIYNVNVVSTPGVDGELVMRVASNLGVNVMRNGQVRYIDGRPWVMVSVPGSQTGATAECGWVRAQDLASPTHESLEQELG